MKESMQPEIWYVVIGAIFSVMALAGSAIKRLPLTTSMVYLIVGWLLGPHGFSLLYLDPVRDAWLVERVAEATLILSLFTAGLSLRAAFSDSRWLLTVRLAFGSMALTVALIAFAAVLLLDLPWGAGVLLGAILAPTDPVLASDVQVGQALDPQPLRFSLTGEAGLNDGITFPFITLGLALMGAPWAGPAGWRWVALDLIGDMAIGTAIGWGLGTLLGSLVLHLRRVHREALSFGYFLAPGLIALSYGLALLCRVNGFLAVFAAGVGLRMIEFRESGAAPPAETANLVVAKETRDEIATHPEKAPAYLMEALLDFSQQLEEIGEVVVVVMIGSMLSVRGFSLPGFWIVPILFFGIRPVAVLLSLIHSPLRMQERLLIAWFGIRGIGSVYYVAYSIAHGIPADMGRQLAQLTFAVVAISIGVHGISVTPLMNAYSRRLQRA